jgi:hypothetical protein
MNQFESSFQGWEWGWGEVRREKRRRRECLGGDFYCDSKESQVAGADSNQIVVYPFFDR